MRVPEEQTFAAIEQVEALSSREGLLDIWYDHYEQAPPKGISLKMMKLAVAYKIQAAAYGGLKPALRRHLTDVVENERRVVSPPLEMTVGTRLIRQWHGKAYEAIIEPEGVVVNGRRYKSLSDAARDITGVRWSGPRFFGMVKVKSI